MPRSRKSWVVRLAETSLLVLFLPLIIAITIVAFTGFVVYSVGLHLIIWLCWCTRGRDVLFVYSDSPIWHDHIEKHVLPHIRARAIVLNWSQRKQWRRSLATAAFRHFGGCSEFNPMGVVFRPFRLTRTFRFWQPFRDFKHGKPELLKRVEAEFLAAVGVNSRMPLTE